MTLQNSINAGKITQDSNGDINLGATTVIDGTLSAYGLLEARESYAYGRLRPWSEAGKFSLRLEVEGDNNTSELEFSIFRGLNTSNSKTGIAVYRTNGTDTVNAYISGAGSSFVCANSGFFGIANNNPQDRLHVSSGFIRCSTGLKLGSNVNQLIYGTAAPTSGTYARGDIIINQAPSAGGFIGWVCVSAGTPGTWKTWGAISA